MTATNNSNQFGENLQIIGSLGIGNCTDAVVDGHLLYIIGVSRTGTIDPVDLKKSYMTGCLYVADISEPAVPCLIGKLCGLGNTRQIEVRDGIAYVASREDGLFIIDVAEPSEPKLITHYDTVEFATGVDIYENFVFVSLRIYGVEIIDILDPKNPIHISTIKIGEAQSVDVCNGYLYAGVWGQQNLTVCDIRDPYNPCTVAVMPVDGRGDGVFVKDNYCYIATGHHARGMVKNDESDPAFGNGNGIEIYDISDPENPVFVSCIKINRFYKLGNDMWDVNVCGNYAFLSHTYNGVYVIDVSDPFKPLFVAHVELPYNIERQEENPVGGIALTDGYIYAAGINSDLYIIDAAGLAGRIDMEPAEQAKSSPDVQSILSAKITSGNNIPVQKEKDLQTALVQAVPLNNNIVPDFRIYKPLGQVYSAALKNNNAYVACGSAGIHIISTGKDPEKISEYATEGFALDIKIANDMAYVAEGNAGMSIWKISDNYMMEKIAVYRAFNNSIKNVIITDDGKYALLHVGSRWFQIVDVTDPQNPELVLNHCPDKGLIYGRQIGNGLFKGRYASCFWHVSGIFWYDVCNGERPKYSGYSQQQRINQATCMAFTPQHAVLIHNKGYALLDHTYTGDLNDLSHYSIKGYDLTGKPSIYGNMMFISDRVTGIVTILDIADIENPKVITCFEVYGNPDIIVKDGNTVAIPSGYQGLLIFDL